MSVHVTAWAWKLPPLRDHLQLLPTAIRVDPVTARAVLVKLADNANDDGQAFPSVETIARETELSERAVQKALRALEQLGLLNATKRPRRTTLYTLHVGAVPTTNKGASDAPIGAVKGAPGDTVRVHPTTSLGAPGAPRTVREPSVNRHSLAAPARREREPDPMWDILDRHLGPVHTTSERGRRNRALSELRHANVDADELDRLIRAYRRLWPNITITPTAIAANLSQLRTTSSPPRLTAAVAPCAECGVGGSLHAADCSHATTTGPDDVGVRDEAALTAARDLHRRLGATA